MHALMKDLSHNYYNYSAGADTSCADASRKFDTFTHAILVYLSILTQAALILSPPIIACMVAVGIRMRATYIVHFLASATAWEIRA